MRTGGIENMKFQISVSPEKYEMIEKFLSEHGIETDQDAEYMVTETPLDPSFLQVRNENRESVRISADDVVFIEAYGKSIELHTLNDTYYSQERMYRFEEILDPKKFIRISKSVIISGKHVKKIRPTLSMKYVLTMSNGTLVDVTRSYYNEFRSFFGI